MHTITRWLPVSSGIHGCMLHKQAAASGHPRAPHLRALAHGPLIGVGPLVQAHAATTWLCGKLHGG